MKLKIIPNPDKNIYEEVSKAVVNNQGYCPCLIEKTQDSKCICKKFIEQQTEGYCHCERFKKVLVN